MKRQCVVLLIAIALLAPSALLAQGRGRGAGNRGQGGGQGNGTQLRQRIHTPGTGLTGTQADRVRAQKRDGTGPNSASPNCPNNSGAKQKATPTTKK